MRTRIKAKYILVLIAALLSGCASGQKTAVHPAEGHRIQNGDSAYVSDSLREAEYRLSAGEFRKSIEIYSVLYGRRPADVQVRKRYLKAIERTRNTAEEAYERNQYAEAGLLFNLLMRSEIKEFISAGQIDIGKEYLDNRLKSCAKALTENGLLNYREGKLEAAIAEWKKVLVFDRENTEVKKAIETARIQLESLEKVR